MAGGLLLLLDDIASVLDDVATLTKVAVQKTSGVLGDDLALNAQQVSGVDANRELPIVWAVAKGSFFNKAILVPAAIGLSAIAPWAITPLLIIGGAYLCFEGVEKLVHTFLHRKHHHPKEDFDVNENHADLIASKANEQSVLTSEEFRAVEKEKVSGAIRTDFILSAEIIVITLGTLGQATFWVRVSVLIAIAIVMTVGVYGLVAAIVKLDDVGEWLLKSKRPGFWGRTIRATGLGLFSSTPYLMRFLSIAGTAAMFLVGGGILAHGVPAIHHWIEHLVHPLHDMPWFETIAKMSVEAMIGVLVGAVIVAAYIPFKK